MSIGYAIAAALGAYLLGSVPFGVVLTRLFTGKDVRQVGSGNIGASNVARAAGKGVGVLTLVLDAAKASVPMLVARGLAHDGDAARAWAVVIGVAAFVGHLWPVWLRFKGGKGVATALGVFAVLSPISALAGLVGFGVAYGATRVPAVGSLTGTTLCFAGAVIQEWLRLGGPPVHSPVVWAGLAIGATIFVRHRSNLARLRQGAEHKV